MILYKYLLNVKKYPDQKVEGNPDECTAKCMNKTSPESYTLSHTRNSGLWAWGLVTRNHAIEIRIRVDPHYSMRIRLKIQFCCDISFTPPSCEMGHNRQVLKFISIAQIIMSAIFLALGMADRYEARFMYTSYLFIPCWIAALVSTLRC